VTVHDGSPQHHAAEASLPQHESILRKAGRADAPHRRFDGRQLPAGSAKTRRADDELEDEAILGRRNLIVAHSRAQARSGALRRVLIPQRDAWAARAPRVSADLDEMAYRFRDVYDTSRLSRREPSVQDRVTGILERYLSTISNRSTG
jgi:hypothetical protein